MNAAVGPCGRARSEVETRCAEATRLIEAAAGHDRLLAEARRELAAIGAQQQALAELTDRRRTADAKGTAQRQYRLAIVGARSEEDVDRAAMQVAADRWLRDIDQLNRELLRAGRERSQVADRSAELHGQVPGYEAAARTARIAADAAETACHEARRLLAECEEALQRRAAAADRMRPGAQTQVQPGPPAGAQPALPPISLVLRGDRATVLGVARRMADETGLEAGRLQLLLLELREGILAAAVEATAIGFPAGHPFWGQFSADDGRAVAAALAAMGYRFDGHGGWSDGRAPTARELGIAVAHCGHDPRALRRPAGQAAIDGLWHGSTVEADRFLAAAAPQLSVKQMMAVLGPRGARLGDLWDVWGRLRPLLVG